MTTLPTTLYLITQEQIDQLRTSVAKEFHLIVPSTDAKPSIKDYLFPQRETLFNYKNNNGQMSIDKPSFEVNLTVFWGVQPCDLQAVALMDKVFLAPEYPDERYRQRREASRFVAFYCRQPKDACFCSSLPYFQTMGQGADLLFYPLTETTYLAHVNQKGADLLAAAGLELPVASAEQSEALLAVIEAFKSQFAIQFKLDGPLKDLPGLFADPYFKETAFKCLDCRICTYVCPTCHCFSINDHEGCRFRCWDSCQDAMFTLMAGGHNPRQDEAARTRQRILHKGYYAVEKYNEPGCVGCGRCITACPVSMDITEGLRHVRK